MALRAAVALLALGCGRPAPRAPGLEVAALGAAGPGAGGPPAGDPAAVPAPAPTVAAPSPTPTLVPPRPTVTPTPRPPTPTPVVQPPPRLLEIPKIGVAAPVVELRTRPNGEMEVPAGPELVGWFVGSPRPGEPGNAVLTGHLDWAGPPPRPAVFWRLKELAPGDPVYVRTERERLPFTVEDSAVYERETAPVERILGFAMGRVVTLITCEGRFLPAERDYTHRRVVRARSA